MHYSRFLSTAEKNALALLDLTTIREKIVSMGWTYKLTDYSVNQSAHQYVKGDVFSQGSPRIVFYFERLSPDPLEIVHETHCKSVCAIAEAEDMPTALVIAALSGEFPWPMTLENIEMSKGAGGRQSISADVLGQQTKIIWWKNNGFI